MEEKKKSKKGIIIAIVIVLVVIVGAIGGYFAYQQIEANKPIEEQWGQTYYTYIADTQVQEESVKNERGLSGNIENAKIEFCDVDKEQEPVMVISYVKDSQKYANIYYIEDNNVNCSNYNTNPTEVKLLYNVEDKQYNWYVKEQREKEETYTPIEKVINKDETELKEYTIKEGEETSVETLKGEKISIPKFDEVFVDPNIENKKLDFSNNLEEKEIKEVIKTGVEEFEEQEKLITEDVKTQVEEKEKETESKREQIKVAKEEIKKKQEEEAKKKAEEEAKKKAAEEAKGLKVGKYRLKYGTYKSDVYRMDSSMYGTIILRADGTFHVKANCEGGYPYPKLDCDGTYKVGTVLNSFTKEDAINFTTNTGVKFSLSVTSNNSLSDQWHGYSYTGK